MKPPTWSVFAVALTLVGCAPPGPSRPVSTADHLRQTIHVGPPLDTTVSFLAAGDASGPRVVLVHGTPGSADGWTDYLADPIPGMEVVALDRPGFGQSGPEGAVVPLEQQAAAVAALLAPDRPTILLGHSFGGPIVAWVAARYPDRVAAIVLLAASLDPGLEKIHPMQHVGTWWPVRPLLPRPIRNANAELMGLKPELERLAELLALIRCPVLIVHGTEDDLVPFANVDFMERAIAGACRRETVVLPGSNHFLPWNAADTVRAAIVRAGELTC